MKTEHVEEVIQKMDWVVLQMSVKPSKLHSLAGSLTTAWEGGGASRYANEIRQLATRLQHVNSDLQRLGIRTRSEIAEWEQMDATHDFAVAKPTYLVAPGEGPIQPKSTKVNYSPIISSIVDVGNDAKDFLDAAHRTFLPPYNGLPTLSNIQLPSWLGPALLLVDIGVITANIYQDVTQYTNPDEQRAAFVIDLAFEVLIKLLSAAATAASIEMLRDGIGAALTGVFVVPALITAALGGVLWISSTVGASLLKTWFYSPNVHNAIVKSVAKKMISSPTGTI